MLHSPAFPPARVVDTVGAGDTFNAALIFQVAGGNADVASTLRFACAVAGRKVGQRGFAGLSRDVVDGALASQEPAEAAAAVTAAAAAAAASAPGRG